MTEPNPSEEPLVLREEDEAEQYSDDISISSSLAWELDEGIPQPEDEFIQKYFAGRESLIANEKKQRHDRLFRQTMSPIARQAGQIIASIRERELGMIWTPKLEDDLSEEAESNLFPGMMFSLARSKMETTDLWRIIDRMPKGALLHAHMDAMLEPGWLIDQALSTKGCMVMADQPLVDARSRAQAMVRFRFLPDEQHEATKTSLWREAYQAWTLVPVGEAMESFSDGQIGFRQWLMSKISITDEESLKHHHGLDTIWKKFLSCFRVLGSILGYEPIFRQAMQKLFKELSDNGITYVDFRTTFITDFYLDGQTIPQTGYDDWFRIWGEEIEKFKESQAKVFGARMIWTVIRAFDNRSIVESMKECIRMKQKYPHLICGFDCVGQEDPGRTLADLTPILFWFKKQCFQVGVNIPFFFHAGECLGDGNSTDNNLFDAILLGTRRIGHGYSLYKHPLLIDMVKDKKLLIECCPISNEVLRLSSSILAHSVPALLSRGVAVSLNNDDPGILGHGRNGLTHDFWQLLMASENLGLEGLATMAENSLRWCASEDYSQADWLKSIEDGYLGKDSKAEMLKAWRSEFEKWCQWIILEFPLEVES